MSGQAGGAGAGGKGKTPPNPNFGGGVGPDLSNGIDNGAAATGAGTAPMTPATNPAASTATPAPTGQTTTTTASASMAPGAKGGGKGQQPPGAAGPGATPEQTGQSSYASTMAAALKGQPAPLPGASTTGGNMWRGQALSADEVASLRQWNATHGDPSTMGPSGGAMGAVWTDEDRKRAAEGEAWQKAHPEIMAGGSSTTVGNEPGIVRMPGDRRGDGTARVIPAAAPQTPLTYEQWKTQQGDNPTTMGDYQKYTETLNQPPPPQTSAPPAPQGPWGGQGLQAKLQAKGANPPAPAGAAPPPAGAAPPPAAAPTGGGAGPLTGPLNSGAFAPPQASNDPWLARFKTGTDLSGASTADRAANITKNAWGNDLNAGQSYYSKMNPGAQPTEDWQAMIRQMAGQPNGDPVALMKQAMTQPGQAGANVRQVMEASGLSSKIGAQLENAFAGGGRGADAEQAYKRLGIVNGAVSQPAASAQKAYEEQALAGIQSSNADQLAKAKAAQQASLLAAPDAPTGYMPGSPEDIAAKAARHPGKIVNTGGPPPPPPGSEPQRGENGASGSGTATGGGHTAEELARLNSASGTFLGNPVDASANPLKDTGPAPKLGGSGNPLDLNRANSNNVDEQKRERIRRRTARKQ